MRAWRYFRGRLGPDDAQRMMLDCQHPAGWHPLLVLTVEDTLEGALQTYADGPALRELVAEACEHVGYRWESYGDELSEARRWALEKLAEYAAERSITLVLAEGEEEEGG